MKNFYERWLIQLSGFDTVKIKKRTCSRHMPINRMLAEVGFYPVDFIDVNGSSYFYTFHKDELHTKKSEVFIGKVSSIPGDTSFEDMGDDDLKNLDYFKEHFFHIKRNPIN